MTEIDYLFISWLTSITIIYYPDSTCFLIYSIPWIVLFSDSQCSLIYSDPWLPVFPDLPCFPIYRYPRFPNLRNGFTIYIRGGLGSHVPFMSPLSDDKQNEQDRKVQKVQKGYKTKMIGQNTETNYLYNTC